MVMPGNSSATGGYLLPTSSPVAYDNALEDIFHDAFVGVSGMPPQYVRPAWQPKAPNQLAAAVDWCAFAIQTFPAEDFPQQTFNALLEPGLAVTRHEYIKVLVSTYGPNASANSSLIGTAFYVAQNREALGMKDISFIDAKEPILVPDLINAQWIKRVDLPMLFRRPLTRTYNVENIVSINAPGTTSAINPNITFSS
jgi:hypothetical protein